MQPVTPAVPAAPGPHALAGPHRAPAAEPPCSSEELNRRILEAVPAGVVTVAADGASFIASNVSWNGSLATKASTSFGYLASSGTTPAASAFSCMPA